MDSNTLAEQAKVNHTQTSRFLCTVWVSSSACGALGRRLGLRYTAPRGARWEWALPPPAAMPYDPRSRTMPERCTLDGFVITPIEPPGSRYAGTDHGRLFINEARTGVMARVIAPY